MIATRRRTCTRLAALLVLAAGCSTPEDPSDLIVAWLNGEPLSHSDFEAYLDRNLPDDYRRAIDEAQRDEVLSRLLDNFVEERVLLSEALRAGIQIADGEVQDFIEASGQGRDGPGPGGRYFESVRALLTVQKLLAAHAQSAGEVTPEEVSAHLASTRRNERGERLVLRSLLLESTEVAERIHREIRKKRMTFREAVVAHGEAPGQGIPLEMTAADLPPEVAETLADLRPGRVSRPVELDGSIYLFQLVSRGADDADDEEALLRAAQEVARSRREQVQAELVTELVSRAKIEIERRDLPFSYVPPDDTVSSTR